MKDAENVLNETVNQYFLLGLLLIYKLFIHYGVFFFWIMQTMKYTQIVLIFSKKTEHASYDIVWWSFPSVKLSAFDPESPSHSA